MSFDSTVTEHDLHPAVVEFGEELKRERRDVQSDFDVDAFEDTLGQRILRLFRRERG